MKEMLFCFTVDDVGMNGYSTEPHLQALLDFWAQEGLRATLFVVPRCGGKGIGEHPGYVRLLTQAHQRGHDLAQHGLDHDRFECGIPPKMILDLPHEGPAREYLATQRAAIEAALTVPNLRSRLHEGRTILEAALRLPIRGFRAPCLSICDHLFEALEAEGYAYDSSRHLQEAGWDILNGKTPVVPRPITRAIFAGFQRGAMRELPLTAEYTWYLRRAQVEVTMGLAQQDFDACLAAGIPFVPVCHVSPIQEGDPDLGFQFYRDLLAHARNRCREAGVALVSATLAEASTRGMP
jgi:predicted deacetylase